MSSIGGLTNGSAPWSGMQRLQPPSRDDLLRRAEAQGSGGVEAADLRQMMVTRSGAAVSASPGENAARGTALADGGSSRAPDATATRTAPAAPALPAAPTVEFAQLRGAGLLDTRVGLARPAAQDNGGQPAETPEAGTPLDVLSRALNAAVAMAAPRAGGNVATASHVPVQQAAPNGQAERFAGRMLKHYASGGGACANLGSQLSLSA
jgi:hypothetical protein